jgi:uncharacterized protein YndB with AHSA1/START domain
MSVATPATTAAIDIRRTLAARPQEVYDAWARTELFQPWIAPDGRVLQDTRVDGLFFIGMREKEKVYPHYGRYLAVEPGRKLEFTWVSKATRGHESVVTLTFAPAGEGTAFHLVHTGFPDAEAAAPHQEGWSHFVGELAKRFG